MELLQRIHGGLPLLDRSDSLHRGLSSSNCGNRGDPGQHGSPANGFLIKERVSTARRIDDKLDTIALDQVDHIRPAFLDFEDPLDREP